MITPNSPVVAKLAEISRRLQALAMEKQRGVAARPGEEREWKVGRMMKMQDGSWKHVPKGHEHYHRATPFHKLEFWDRNVAIGHRVGDGDREQDPAKRKKILQHATLMSEEHARLALDEALEHHHKAGMAEAEFAAADRELTAAQAEAKRLEAAAKAGTATQEEAARAKATWDKAWERWSESKKAHALAQAHAHNRKQWMEVAAIGWRGAGLFNIARKP